MPNQVGTSQVIRFATFEVDLQAQELRKAGLRLKLSGQPFQVLAILLEKPGTVVTPPLTRSVRRWATRRRIHASSRPCHGVGIDSSALSRLMERLLPKSRKVRRFARPAGRNRRREREDALL